MSYTFRIPRQKDHSLVEALTKVRDAMADSVPLTIRVQPHVNGPDLVLDEKIPTTSPTIDYILRENSEIMAQLRLFDPASGHEAMAITRNPNEIADTVVVHWNQWVTRFPGDKQSLFFVKLNAAARRFLRAIGTDASFVEGGVGEWSRYRDAQQAILSSLEETQKSVVVEFTRHRLEAEAAAKASSNRLESELRTAYEVLTQKLSAEHQERMDGLNKRESAIAQREESFNTKEARYVARQEQQNQIEQIKGWLKEWSLTKGTTTKRTWVIVAYLFGMLSTLGFAIWFGAANVEILKGKDLASVAWWQWVLLSLKSILPLGAFTTFVVYFIRWQSAWARQHAEEEFKNRARILDIGRTSWLLEAVRDAQDNNKQLPAELLKELSRNLFSYASNTEAGDVNPQAVGDLLLQGLSSIRVKSADGTEVEASRSKNGK